MRPLPHDRWHEIDRLFAAALERPDAEREAFVDRACGGDAELAREVRLLLARGAEAEAALGESVTGFAAPLLSALGAGRAADARDGGLAAGARLGPYRILAEIGRGGMGAVYLAERADDQFEKRVAIKLVKGGRDTEEVLRRFRAERQILATLEHPNIARLYDGGVSEDGLPYLVMEYVDGRPIHAYCDEHALDVGRRLALFRAVCDAVQFAHQNLVVHRDIKPSNVLVTADGTAKLLDFGIAKLLQAGGEAGPPGGARPSLRALTPEYAAPEQHLGRPVTTASDVYALGVVLYELLCGRRPFEAGGAGRYGTADALVRRAPERPSALAASGAAEAAAARGTSPARLARRLRGDLDAIVLKALEHEPERRYESARQLADDIDRHLAGVPVAARRLTLGYRVGRFVRRRRAAVAAGAAVSALVAALAALYSARLTHERDLARRQHETAEQVVGFLSEMLTAAAPGRAPGDTLTLYYVLARSEARLDTALAARPEAREELWRVMGATYGALGDAARARRLLERAYALGRSLRGAGDSAVVGTATLLAGALQQAGERDSAERLVRGALAARRARHGESHPLVAASLSQLGALLRANGDANGAAELAAQALAINRQAGAGPLALADNLDTLAALRRAQGRAAEAEPLLREALALRRAALGPDDPAVPAAAVSLAALLRERGALAPAESLFRAALEARRRVLGPDHPDVAAALIGLGTTLHARGAYAAADSAFRQAVELGRRAPWAGRGESGLDLDALAVVLDERDGDIAADRLNREALGLIERTLSRGQPNAARPLVAVGALFVERGEAQAAEPMLRRAAAARRERLGANHMLTIRAEAELGWCLVQLGRFAEAESLLVRSHAMWRAPVSPRDTAAVRRLRGRIVELYARWKQPERAAEYARLLAADSTR